MIKRSLFLCTASLFSIYANATSFATNVTGGTVTSNINMTVKASCAASVADIDFGEQSVSDIKNGKVVEKPMTIAITCDATLASYTMALTSADGVDATKSILKTKQNTTIGYQLTWKTAEMAAINTPVLVDGVAKAPVTKPTTPNVSIPINVKPVLLGTTGSPGAASTALNIKLTFN